MKSNRRNDGMKRVELKYCEHCGGLWVREGGGGVYCEKCQPLVADLPAGRRKRPRRVVLPIGKRVVTEDFEAPKDDGLDLEGVGGVA